MKNVFKLMVLLPVLSLLDSSAFASIAREGLRHNHDDSKKMFDSKCDSLSENSKECEVVAKQYYTDARVLILEIADDVVNGRDSMDNNNRLSDLNRAQAFKWEARLFSSRLKKMIKDDLRLKSAVSLLNIQLCLLDENTEVSQKDLEKACENYRQARQPNDIEAHEKTTEIPS